MHSLCSCPLHRENQHMAGDASKLHLGFCDIACTHILDWFVSLKAKSMTYFDEFCCNATKC